jgi:hypothetical protein
MFPQGSSQGGYSQGAPSSSSYYSSIQGLAITCAIACTLLAAPWLANNTEDFAEGLILNFYGQEFLDFGVFIWKALCFGFVFFITRAFIVAAIVAFGVGLAQRFPMLIA